MSMSNVHSLVFDPISFKGGSKIATLEALLVCQASKTKFTVLTADPESWRHSGDHDITVIKLPTIKLLAQCHHGIAYWLNQLFLFGILLWFVCTLRKVDKLIGASGPGIDMPLYFLKKILSLEIVQLIHGSVGKSRSIGYCLSQADHIYYLHSARASILAALNSYYHEKFYRLDVSSLSEWIISQSNFNVFVNGISQENWPTRCQMTLPTIFWCASLLKWKGLDKFIEAAKLIHPTRPLTANICFIRPKDISLPVSQAPQNISHFRWFEDPDNLDHIRSQSNIFVSTSTNEPFGLSILEALAAGMCVILPDDDSYWSKTLTDFQQCIKYKADDPVSLCTAIFLLLSDKNMMAQLSQNAVFTAQEYRAESRYLDIAKCIEKAKEPIGECTLSSVNLGRQ